VRNHTKTVALYCAEKDYEIRCNSIHPAAVLTPMWEPFLGKGEHRKEMLTELMSQVPLKMIGEAKDVAYAVVYLASDESKYITGAELVLDGGILAGSQASPSKK
jgi:3(or 17)beta-hydroxysteroid dehydrogenase